MMRGSEPRPSRSRAISIRQIKTRANVWNTHKRSYGYDEDRFPGSRAGDYVCRARAAKILYHKASNGYASEARATSPNARGARAPGVPEPPYMAFQTRGWIN